MPELNRRAIRSFIERLSLTNDSGNNRSNSSKAASPTTPSSSGIRVENTVSIVSAPHSEGSDSNMTPSARDRRVSFANELSVAAATADKDNNHEASSNAPTSAEEHGQPSSSQQSGLGDDNNDEIPESASSASNAQNTTTFANADGNSNAETVIHLATPVSNAQASQTVQAEEFPALQLSPFHQNSMTGRNTIRNYELPGQERYPRYPDTRTINGSWMNGRFDRFTVGGRTFFVPVHLLLRYQFWRLLAGLERPATGWHLPNTDPNIFALVIECLVSASGFEGTEHGLNLVKLLVAAKQAVDWGMEREVTKFVATIRRYIARRLFFRNPHRPDLQGVMDHNYFVYRSEELYRAWKVVQSSRALQKFFVGAEFVSLYSLVVPLDIWPALTADFSDEFNQMIDFTSRLRVVPVEVTFHDWWLRFFRLAGYLDYEWMGDVPSVLNMFFRQYEEAARDAEEEAQAGGNVPVGQDAAANGGVGGTVNMHVVPPVDAEFQVGEVIDIPLSEVVGGQSTN